MCYVVILALLVLLGWFAYKNRIQTNKLTAELELLQRYLSDPRFTVQPSGRFREDLRALDFFVEYTKPSKIDVNLSPESLESIASLISVYISMFEIRHGRHPEYTELAFVPIETIRSQLYAFR